MRTIVKNASLFFVVLISCVLFWGTLFQGIQFLVPSYTDISTIFLWMCAASLCGIALGLFCDYLGVEITQVQRFKPRSYVSMLIDMLAEQLDRGGSVTELILLLSVSWLYFFETPFVIFMWSLTMLDQARKHRAKKKQDIHQ